LRDSLISFHGILVFSTNRISTIDYSIAAFVKETFTLPQINRDDRLKIFYSFLEYTSPLTPHEGEPPKRDHILDWFKDAIEDWHPSSIEIRDLVVTATSQASVARRALNLDDLITVYTAKTGKQNDWDFVADETLVYGEAEDIRLPQTISEVSVTQGEASVPDDGRLPLELPIAFRELFSPERIMSVVDELKRVDGIRIVDWGWPRGRWRRQAGCIYRFGKTAVGSPAETASASAFEKWNKAGFTFGLRRLLQNDESDADTGKPWRRLM
jgi:hypothetical protein